MSRTAVASAIVTIAAFAAMPAQAAVRLVDRAGFTAEAPTPRDIQPLAFNGTASSVTLGSLFVTAGDGAVFGDGIILSTELERDSLTIVPFVQPLFAFGALAGVTGSDGGFVEGLLTVTVTEVGRPATALELANGANGPAFLGLLSTAGITQLTLGLASFDLDATSTPFVALTGSAELTLVPLPAGAVLLLPALASLAFAARRRC